MRIATRNNSVRRACLLIIPLVALFLAASIAAVPAVLSKPGTPTVAATADPGEITVSWAAVSGAQFYTVGWINQADLEEMQATDRDWQDAIHYATIPATYTSHTVSGLKPNGIYYAMVGARASRYGGETLAWSDWSTSVTTAGQHGEGFCPVTGLPIPAVGYLSVGEQVRSVEGDQSFTLTSSSTPGGITLSHAENALQLFSPRAGRRFVEVCGTYSHDFADSVAVAPGWETIMGTDAGVGFARDSTHRIISPGTSGSGCEVWDVPAAAQTAVYAVGLGADNSRTGVSGVADSEVGLYRIDLTAQATPTPTPTATATATPTAAPTPEATLLPTRTPRPTNTPRPTATPRPTNTPRPTATPRPSSGDVLDFDLTECKAGRSIDLFEQEIIIRGTLRAIEQVNDVRVYASLDKSILPDAGDIIIPAFNRGYDNLGNMAAGATRSWDASYIHNGSTAGFTTCHAVVLYRLP